MTLKRDTRRWLAENPDLFGQVLARMCGAWDVETAVDEKLKPPKPWEVCRDMGLAYGALLDWVSDDDQRKAKFERALALRSHLFAEEVIDIADGDGLVGRDKLRVETRKWLASRWNRPVYGEQLAPQMAVQINIGDAAERLAQLERELGFGAALPPIEQALHGAVSSPPLPALDRPAGGDDLTPAAGAGLTSPSDPAPISQPVPVSEEFPEL